MESLLERTQKQKVDTSATPMLPRAFYASTFQDLREAVPWVKEHCEDFHANHVLRDEWRSELRHPLWAPFFPIVDRWNGANERDVQLATMMNAKSKAYRMRLPPELEESMKTPTFVLDPLQNEQLREKLLDQQLRHMQEFLSSWRQRADANREANPRIVDFSPRYYTTSMRDLHRAVDWYRKLKEGGM